MENIYIEENTKELIEIGLIKLRNGLIISECDFNIKTESTKALLEITCDAVTLQDYVSQFHLE